MCIGRGEDGAITHILGRQQPDQLMQCVVRDVLHVNVHPKAGATGSV
jgi:hypothetical protein